MADHDRTTTAGAPALEVRGVTKSFGTTSVLDGVDLVVPVGSITAVLGPSGGGKTTLLRIVAGFERPDAGTVSIGGTRVADHERSMPPELRRVGVVPQEGALFPHLSVAGNVGFGLDRDERRSGRIAEVLELVGLPGIEHKRPHELSGGMQHRVALARALAPRPAIVMLDEPFSSLDAGLRAQVRGEVLEALKVSGATAVIVTHDQLEALSIADQVAVLLGGRIAQAADPTQVYHLPASLEVGTFVGDAVVLPGEFVSGHRPDVAVVRCALGDLDAGIVTTTAMTPGDAIDVLVRPEQLAVHDDDHDERPVGASADSPGARGTVVGRQYYGHDAVVMVRLDAGPTVTARLQTSRLPVAGSAVHVRATERVVAFPRRGR
ncbi:MAG: ABC transporter ATP-binding protein [Actinobacteria bacterium]|nr:ABC transporter ATP-binding protein [Actinomycetota bacterium]